jgi:hypothetical protein
MHSKHSKRLGEVLIEMRLVKPEDLTSTLSYQMNVPIVDLQKININAEAINLVPEEVARKSTVLPLELVDDTLVVAMAYPDDIRTIRELGIKTGMLYEDKRDEIYAADAGVENAIYRIINNVSPISDMEESDNANYQIFPVNGQTVDVTVNRLSMVYGILGEDEYRIGAPHENWIEFEDPSENATRNYEEGWVEFPVRVYFTYTGAGIRQIQAIGTYFAPYPGGGLIDRPYETDNITVITFDNLDVDSPETKIVQGGFTFLWRWEKNKGPIFQNKDGLRTGSLLFKFKINNPDWNIANSFIFATIKEQDVSYVSNSDMSKWQVEVIAGNTKLISYIILKEDQTSILTWELNPPN